MADQKYIMRHKRDRSFFVNMRPGTEFGDLMTNDPNEAAIYNHPDPGRFACMRRLWEAVKVEVTVVIKGD